ncbi:MAG: DUF3301 domain-containing protein [Shewanella sp.]|nr:DUF3301 domain-containing protein [Shewanella sp.]MCF1429321.1 DUF3301 domain-containing protein [Shewanella sp.]MCF1439631.1 DUF3301 domain-containing protein [Shewanella sp.]
MMTDLLIILGLLVVAAFFWQLRQMAEQSRRFVETECSKQKVQLLSVAMVSARPCFGGHTGIGWKARFQFEFSTDGMNQFRAHISMLGNRVTQIEWPIFPEPEWHQAPLASGSIGGGCGSRGGCNSGRCR